MTSMHHKEVEWTTSNDADAPHTRGIIAILRAFSLRKRGELPFEFLPLLVQVAPNLWREGVPFYHLVIGEKWHWSKGCLEVGSLSLIHI